MYLLLLQTVETQCAVCQLSFGEIVTVGLEVVTHYFA